MTRNEEHLLDQLERICNLVTDDDIDTYVYITRSLPESDNPECLRRMLHCFRDVDAGEAQYELVEACERFPVDVYLTVFVSEAMVVSTVAPQWFELLLCSILNSNEYVEVLGTVLAKVNQETAEDFRTLVRVMALRHGRYQSVLQRLST